MEAKKTATQVPAVPESVLRRRKIAETRKAEDVKQRLEQRKKNRANRKIIFKKAESYIQEYRNQEKSLLRYKRTARAAGNYYVAPESKLALVVRIRGINQIHPKPRKVLQLMRLRQINMSVMS